MAGGIWGREGTGRRLVRCPVVLATAVLACACTLAGWSGRELLPVSGGPWRHLTRVLPHADLLHVAFNLYWLVRFGVEVESVLRPARTLGLVLLLAAGSSAWQEIASGPGIGLSGLGYGLFGLLWVLSSRDRRFRGVVDANVVGLFIAWFLLCIVLTWTGTWNVGNVAHGAGAVLGAAAGAAIASAGGRRVAFGAAALATALAGVVLAETPLPHHLTDARLARLREREGHDAATRGAWAEAERRFAEAVALDPALSGAHHNRGVALHRLGNLDGAAAAFATAAACATDEPSRIAARLASLDVDVFLALQGRRWDDAESFATEAIALDPNRAYAYHCRGLAREALLRLDEAKADFREAHRLEPANEEYLKAKLIRESVDAVMESRPGRE